MTGTVERLRVGIIGTGRISDLHAAEYVMSERADIAAVCDLDADAARARARSWGAEPDSVYTDWRELLADDSLDAVEILLPHHMHLEVGLAAMEAGKHVSAQKPMALDIADADRYVAAAEAAEARGQVVRIVENFLFYPPVARLIEIVLGGEIGEILSVRQKSLSGDPSYGWDVPQAAAAWRLDPERCGGGPLVFDDGLHKFSIFWSLLGIASEVHAWIGATEVEGGALDSPSSVSLRWEGGAIGHLEVVNAPDLYIKSRHYAQDDRVEVTGTSGVAWVNRGHGHLLEEAPLRVYKDGRATDHVDLATGWESSFVFATRDFVNAITDGGSSLLPARTARDILSTALAAQLSAREARVVRPDEVP